MTAPWKPPGPRPRPSLPAIALLAVTVASGCKTDPEEEASDLIQHIRILTSEVVPSVVMVDWTTTEPTTGTVDFGPTGDLRFRTTSGSEPSTEHHAVLVGLVPGSDGALVINAVTASETVSTEELSFSTGFLPAGTPWVDVETYLPDSAWGAYTLIPIRRGEEAWLSVLNSDGAVIWSYEVRQGAHHLRPAPDGSGLYYNQYPEKGEEKPEEPEEEDGETLYHISWEGEELWSLFVPTSHHDFVLLDDEHYATIGTEHRVVDTGTLGQVEAAGDTILLFDRSGSIEQLWSLHDHVVFDEAVYSGFGVDEQGTVDWSHGNYLTWDAERGLFYTSLRHLDAIIAVDGETGEQAWAASNVWGDYQSPKGEEILAWPHSAEMTEEGLVVFSQGYDYRKSICSWASTLRLDDATGAATPTWEYRNEECSKVSYLGSTHPLPNGNHLVVFSQDGIMDEVTPEGEVVQRMTTELEWEFAYAIRVESLQPVTVR